MDHGIYDRHHSHPVRRAHHLDFNGAVQSAVVPPPARRGDHSIVWLLELLA